MGMVSVRVANKHPLGQMWAVLKDGTSKQFSREPQVVDEALVGDDMRAHGFFVIDKVAAAPVAEKAEVRSKKEEVEQGAEVAVEEKPIAAPAAKSATKKSESKLSHSKEAAPPKHAPKKGASKKSPAKKGK